MNSEGSKTFDPGEDQQPQSVAVPKHEIDVVTTAANRDDRQSQDEDRDWEKRIAKATLRTNIVLAVFGFVGAVVLIWQLVELQKSNEETRRANRASENQTAATQRARLAVDPSTYEIIMDTGGNPLAPAVQIKNYGVLPATDVRHNILLEVRGPSPALEEPMRIPAAPEGEWMSWPRSVIWSGASLRIEPVQPRRLDWDSLYGQLVFIHGLVQYNDGFGNDRTLRFCAFTDHYHENLGGVGRWQPCHRHNWAD